MAPEIFAAYALASLLLILLPGPMVTLIIANSLTHGTRAGLTNIAGSEAGLALVVAVVCAGLASLVSTLGVWFEWVRLLGAVYLLWLGWKLLRSTGDLAAAPKPRGGFFLQGFFVSISNPKTLLFVGAFFPQFLDSARPQLPQFLIMGITFMVIAAVCDSMYAVLSGRAGAFLSQNRVRLLSRVSGAFLIGGGAWLALSRAK